MGVEGGEGVGEPCWGRERGRIEETAGTSKVEVGEEREACQHFVQTSWRGKHKQTASEQGAREGKEERGEVDRQSMIWSRKDTEKVKQRANRTEDRYIYIDMSTKVDIMLFDWTILLELLMHVDLKAKSVQLRAPEQMSKSTLRWSCFLHCQNSVWFLRPYRRYTLVLHSHRCFHSFQDNGGVLLMSLTDMFLSPVALVKTG